jgi:hypothetical protein
MRNQIDNHPIRTLAVLLVAAFGFFQVSASGQPGTDWSNGPSALGNAGWIAFLLSALTFLVVAVYSLVRRIRTHRAA